MKTLNLKPVSEQVIVITGASSGIGLTTARLAASKGAQLMLISRNGGALERLVEQLRERHGTEALYHVADVADAVALRAAAVATVERFGRIDTWVNNAGISIYGRLTDVTEADHRRLFETNFWGLVHGSLLAIEHLKADGGALINLGSEASEHAIPLQGMYTASKQAIQGFTDALRLELEQDDAPISVTLIRPTGIDTMFGAHAKNYLPMKPKLPPPVYAPDVVAEAILAAAARPIRDVYVGAAARLNTIAQQFLPRVVDRVAERFFFGLQQTDVPASGPVDGALYEPVAADLQEREGHPGHVFETSQYTRFVTSSAFGRSALAGKATRAASALIRSAARRINRDAV